MIQSNMIDITILLLKICIESQNNTNMPLTNNVIIKLNEITAIVEDKSKLTEYEIDEIKLIFKELVEKNERYDLDEIEFWFENEGNWNTREPRIRIVNLANYVQDKYQQTAHLRIISDDDCGC